MISSERLKGIRRITAGTALWLSKYFGNSAKFWLGFQADFEMEEAYRSGPSDFDQIKPQQKCHS